MYGKLKSLSYLEMQVFNRWGEKVFDSNDHHFKWDGTYKGDVCQQGVYIYYITTKGANGTENEYKGTITLVK